MRLDGRLNQFKYIDTSQEHLLVLVKGKHGGINNFVLQEDSSRPHRAHNVGKYLALHAVRRLDWAPQSPDMNPIENGWSVLGTRLRERPQHPTTLDDLFTALSEEWDRLPVSLFARLWVSMPSRVAAVVKARRYSTKYSVEWANGSLQATSSCHVSACGNHVSKEEVVAASGGSVSGASSNRLGERCRQKIRVIALQRIPSQYTLFALGVVVFIF